MLFKDIALGLRCRAFDLGSHGRKYQSRCKYDGLFYHSIPVYKLEWSYKLFVTIVPKNSL